MMNPITALLSNVVRIYSAESNTAFPFSRERKHALPVKAELGQKLD